MQDSLAVSAYLESNTSTEPDITRNLKAIKLKDAGDWLESTQVTANL